MLTHSLLRDMRYTIIPHQLRGVSDGLVALDLHADTENDLTPYTRPVICVAAFHCRTLLRFLGLQSEGSSIVQGLRGDKVHGVWIGDYNGPNGTPLREVPPCVVESFPDAPQLAQAWTTTYQFAALSLTDALRDARLASGAIAPMLRRTFETLPSVVSRHFYERAVLQFTLPPE